MGAATWTMIDGQWAAWQHGLGTVRAFRRWRPALEVAGSTVGSVADVVEVLRHGSPVEAGRVLRVLIPAARGGDEVAGLAVVQGLRPFLVHLAASYERAGVTLLDDAASDVLAALYAVMCTIDVDRAHLAATVKFRVRGLLDRSPGAHHARRDNIPVPVDLHTDTDDENGLKHERVLWSRVAGEAGERAVVDRVGSIVASGVTRRVLSKEQGRLLLLVSVGHSVASLARDMRCPASTLASRVEKAALLAGKVAA